MTGMTGSTMPHALTGSHSGPTAFRCLGVVIVHGLLPCAALSALGFGAMLASGGWMVQSAGAWLLFHLASLVCGAWAGILWFETSVRRNESLIEITQITSPAGACLMGLMWGFWAPLFAHLAYLLATTALKAC